MLPEVERKRWWEGLGRKRREEVHGGKEEGVGEELRRREELRGMKRPGRG
jgi:hypothetical protein